MIDKLKYPHLFSPITINKTTLKNRIIATPVGDFEKKAMGGAAVVITGSMGVDLPNSMFGDFPYSFSKYKVEETVNNVRKAHRFGAKISAELFHAGAQARCSDPSVSLFGPCDMVNEEGYIVKGMDESDMVLVIDAYKKLAKDVKEAGYDMIFMHFAHGWLAAQFISPLYNHRNDEYGGSLENRAKFPLRILKAVRETVGDEFPIDMRISAVEHMPNSIDFEDTLNFIKMAEPYIDSVQLSCGLDRGFGYEGNVTMATTIFEPHLINVDYATRVKKEVNIPVYAVGAIQTPEVAEELIASGKLDMVAIGRALVADPNWVIKAKNGSEDMIVPCLRCLQCYHIATERRNVGCSVNPCYTNERFIPSENDIVKNIVKKKVVIVGAGPAGISAAIAADKKGNEVTLIEKENEIGGMLRYIVKEHFKEDVARYYEYLKRRIAGSNVNVILNTVATKEYIEKLHPDYLIVAVGSEEIKPSIEGMQHTIVISSLDSIDNYDSLGDTVAIIGGGTVGSELALALSSVDKKNVILVEESDTFAAKGNLLYRISLNQKFNLCKSLKLLDNAVCTRINENGIVVSQNGNIKEYVCDSVIIAVGMKAKTDLANSFYGIVPNTQIIGDCVSARRIMEATFEGYSAGINTI